MATLGRETEKRKAVLSVSQHPSTILSLSYYLSLPSLPTGLCWPLLLCLCSMLDLWVAFRDCLCNVSAWAALMTFSLSIHSKRSFIKCTQAITPLPNWIQVPQPTQHSHAQTIKHTPINMCQNVHATYNFTLFYTHTLLLCLHLWSQNVQPEQDNDNDGTKGSNVWY